MMSEDELTDLYSELNKPYTQEEFTLHCESRMLKSLFEITHSHNHELIALAEKTKLHFDGKGPKPERKLWKMIRPGNNNDNAACARLLDIAKLLSEYEHGSVPMLPIIVYTSRSTATLIERLEKVFPSEHLDTADYAVKEFFCLLAYHGEPKMSREEFRKRLRETVEMFIEACHKHAEIFSKHSNEMYRIRQLEAVKTNDIKDVIIEQHEKTRGKIAASEDSVKKRVKTAAEDLKRIIVVQTEGKSEGCHHRDRVKDKLVQEVINYLAKPGVVYSIHNACKKVCGNMNDKEYQWLYMWCYRHTKDLHNQVDIARNT